MATSTQWKRFNLPNDSIQESMRYGQLMRDGNVRLSNVKHRDIDNVENYTDGKMGEWIFDLWLKANSIPILHTPFREDYSVLNPSDDFIIQVGGRNVLVEVRHKTRNFRPQAHYEHCSDSVKMDRIYVFTDRTRQSDAREQPKTSVGYFRGDMFLLGWITPTEYRNVANFEPEGTLKTSDRGGQLFTLRRDEWNIAISHLHPMEDLIDTQWTL